MPAAIIAAPLILTFAFRRIASWRRWWIPTLAVAPLIVLMNAAFSTIGDGAAVRAGSVTWFAWVALLGVALLRKPAIDV